MTITKETMTKDTTSNDLSISISSRSSEATGHKGRQNSLENISLREGNYLNNLQKTDFSFQSG